MSCSENTAEKRSFGLSCAQAGSAAKRQSAAAPPSKKLTAVVVSKSHSFLPFVVVLAARMDEIVRSSQRVVPRQPGRFCGHRVEMPRHRAGVGRGAGEQLEGPDRLEDRHARAGMVRLPAAAAARSSSVSAGK